LFFGLEVAGPPMLAGPDPRLGAGLSCGAAGGLRTGEETAWPRGRSIFLAAIPPFAAGADLFRIGGRLLAGARAGG
jgi:hypothetical protein